MTDYTQVGNAVKTTFLADSWLGNPANVKTLEVWKRGFMIQDARDARFFNVNELPAIAIVPNAEPRSASRERRAKCDRRQRRTHARKTKVVGAGSWDRRLCVQRRDSRRAVQRRRILLVCFHHALRRRDHESVLTCAYHKETWKTKTPPLFSKGGRGDLPTLW